MGQGGGQRRGRRWPLCRLGARGSPGARAALLADSNGTRYYPWVIKGFANRDTERLFAREPVRRFPTDIRRVMLRKLGHVEAAVRLEDLRLPPGNRLEKLRGTRAGQHSIRINDQWRICFRWEGSDAYDVEIVDYH